MTYDAECFIQYHHYFYICTGGISAPTEQEGVPSRPATASLGFVPNSVLVGQIWPEEVLENAVPSSPWTLREQHTQDTDQEEEVSDDSRPVVQ